jgi:aminopeptidase N
VNSLTPQVLLGADGRVEELAVLQEAAESHPELRPHRVAVGLYRVTDGGALERYARVETDVDGARTVVAELAGADAPDLVLVNDDDLTYCKIRFDETSLATLREHLGAVTDPLARALCWSALWNMTRDALLPARDFVDLVLRFGGRESGIGVVQMLHAWAESAVTHYTAPARRETAARLLAEGARRELYAAGPGSEHQLAWARFFARTATAEADFELLRDLLAGTATVEGLDLDQELRWVFLEPLAAHGAVDEKVLAEELTRDDTASGKRHQVRCLAARPSEAVKAQAWAQVVESDALSNAMVEATIAGFSQGSQRELIAPYAEKYFAAIERVWAERSIQIGMHVVQGLFPSLQQSQETLDATDAWLDAHKEAAPALRRLVLESRDDLARALRGQTCDQASDQ